MNFTSYTLRLFFFIFITHNLPSQSFSLKDSTVVLDLYQQSKTYKGINTDSSIYYLNKGLNIAKEIHFQKGIIRGTSYLGLAYADKGEMEKAESFLYEGVKLAETHHLLAEKATANNNLALYHNNVGKYKEALALAKISLEIFISLKDTLGIGASYGHIAHALSFQNFFEEARNYMFKSIEMYKHLKKWDRVASRYSDIGESYLAEKNTKEAKKYLLESIQQFQKVNAIERMYYPLSNLALCYEIEKNRDSAFFYYDKCRILAEEWKAEDKLQFVWNGMGALYLEDKNWDEAIKYLSMAFTIAQKFQNMQIMHDASANLAEAYENKGDFKNAYLYLRKTYHFKDSLVNADKIHQSADLTLQLERKDAEMRTERLEQENELNKVKLSRKNFAILFILGTMISLMILGALLMRNKQMKTKHQQLELEQKQLRSQMNPHFIFNCLNSIQHYMVYNDIPNANKYLTEFASLMRKTLDILGNDSISLSQEKEYLENYLLLEQMRFDNHFDYQISISPEIDIHQTEIPPMILQPFAENSIRHGFQNIDETHQGKLLIDITSEGNKMLCTIDDNGIGRKKAAAIKSNKGKKHVSFGLDLTKQRMNLLNKLKTNGYDFSIIDKLNETGEAIGTLVKITIPFEV